MEDNVKTFLEKIQELKDKKIKVSVNSGGGVIDCSPLSFKQQKDLISTIADGPIGALKFQKYLNDIIIKNTGLNTLLTTDRVLLILQLRIDAIGDTLKIGDVDVDLTQVIPKISNLKHKTTKTLKGPIKVELDIPDLLEDNKIINATIDAVKREDSEIGKNVGNIYTYEIVKHVKSIVFGEETLLFRDIPVKDRFKIVENLPLSVNKDIISFIQDIKTKETEALTVNIDGEDKSFDIDVSFFDS
tara:strand:+ start:1248 stop:1979 length:732 start_codon:yes stop_codon:yes gene_type:complete